MKKLIYLLLGLFPLIAAAQPAQYAVSLITPENQKLANSVVRNSEMNITINGVDEAEINITYAVTILNKDGDGENAYYEAEGKFEKIKSIEGKLFNTAGLLIRESVKKDIETFGDFSSYGFSDDNTQKLQLYDAQYPYTVEFTVRKILKGFFVLPDFTVQKTGQSLENGRFTLVVPNNYQFQWKGVHTPVVPVKTMAGKSVQWEWQFKDIPAVPYEKYTALQNSVYAQVFVTPSIVEIDGNDGSFANWSTMGRFFYELNKDRDELSADMQEKVAQMTKGLTSNQAKIDTLYRFMQSTCRYVSIQLGIGGWQTFDAQFVEKKQYGDCKALSNYMKSLLKAAGIPAWQALVYAGEDGGRPLYDDAPVPLFNHVILYVPGEKIWLECTSNSSPCGYLGTFTADRPVLLLTPEGGQKINTPAMGATTNTEVAHTTIQLKDDGKTSIQSQFTATGDRHEHYRRIQADYKQDEMEKAFIELQEMPIGKLNLLQIHASHTKPEADIHFEGMMDGYFTRSGKRLFVPLNKMHPFKRSMVADEDRFHDICFTAAYTMTDTVQIVFPAGYKAENVPGPKVIDSEFGHYEIAVQATGDHLAVTRKIIMYTVSAPAARYQEIRKVYLDMAKADAMQVVLVKVD